MSETTRPKTGKGGKGKRKGKGGKRPYTQSQRPDSPETWRNVKSETALPTVSPPSEVETSTRIVNANLSLPWMHDRLHASTQKIIDDLVRSNPAITATAWVPMVDLGKDQSVGPHSTILGGNHCLTKPGEALPVCIACKNPLNFVCQVDRSSLLHPFQSSGLFQVFACPTCVRDPSTKPRVACWATAVDSAEDCEAVEVPAPNKNGRRVVKWLPRKDFLHPCEAEVLLNRPLSAEEWRALGEAQIRGDKIGGCAPWLECPASEKARLKCKLCDKQQRLLLAIDSADNVAFEWGTDGALLVFDCPAHPEQLTALVVST
jgi:hypothetical protein